MQSFFLVSAFCFLAARASDTNVRNKCHVDWMFTVQSNAINVTWFVFQRLAANNFKTVIVFTGSGPTGTSPPTSPHLRFVRAEQFLHLITLSNSSFPWKYLIQLNLSIRQVEQKIRNATCGESGSIGNTTQVRCPVPTQEEVSSGSTSRWVYVSWLFNNFWWGSFYERAVPLSCPDRASLSFALWSPVLISLGSLCS